MDYNSDSSLPERREPHSPNSNHCPAARQRTPVAPPVALPALLTNGVSHKMQTLLQNMDREMAVRAAKKKDTTQRVKAAVPDLPPKSLLRSLLGSTPTIARTPWARRGFKYTVQAGVAKRREGAMRYLPLLIGQNCARYESPSGRLLWLDARLNIHGFVIILSILGV